MCGCDGAKSLDGKQIPDKRAVKYSVVENVNPACNKGCNENGVITFSRSFWENASPAERDAALAHELAHSMGEDCEPCADKGAGQILKAWGYSRSLSARALDAVVTSPARRGAGRRAAEGWGFMTPASLDGGYFVEAPVVQREDLYPERSLDSKSPWSPLVIASTRNPVGSYTAPPPVVLSSSIKPSFSVTPAKTLANYSPAGASIRTTVANISGTTVAAPAPTTSGRSTIGFDAPVKSASPSGPAGSVVGAGPSGASSPSGGASGASTGGSGGGGAGDIPAPNSDPQETSARKRWIIIGGVAIAAGAALYFFKKRG